MEFWLIRHGETYSSCEETYDKIKKTANPKLNDNGIKQAYDLSEQCKNVHFDRIITSDLDRAIETANILCEGRSNIIELDSNFRELNMGDLQLSSWDNFPDLYEEWKKHEIDIPYPNGENGISVWLRCKKTMDQLLEENDQRIAIVCHAGTIKVLLCGYMGLPMEKRFVFDYIENCSITKLRYRNGKMTVYTLNEHEPLEQNYKQKGE